MTDSLAKLSSVKILGIGDQGVGGILISVAKLVIYALCAGINPVRTLPVVLDCGTDVCQRTLKSLSSDMI